MPKDTLSRYEKKLAALQEQLQQEIEAHKKTKIVLRMREYENHAITQSNSYKLARILALAKLSVRRLLAYMWSLNPVRLVQVTLGNQHVRRAYQARPFLDAFSQPASAKVAVILHLYYIEMLPFFAKKLHALRATKHDLYVTIPEAHSKDISKVQSYLPNARVAIVPNRGRDVLPFVEVLKHIKQRGYTVVLKLHSKKSPHRNDGAEWRDRITDSLLPDDSQKIQEVLTLLDKKQVAIVGPANEYVSMLVNFSATLHHTKRLVARVINRTAKDQLIRQPNEYGFFAGTMFWARFDTVGPVVSGIDSDDFEPELGQEDSTLAHALERALCVIPELQNKRIYGMQPNRHPVAMEYATTNIPEWSEYAQEH